MNRNKTVLFSYFISAIFFILITVPQSKAQEVDIAEKILTYVQTVMDKKVDRGECWDLIAFALDHSGANWQRTDGFGKKVNFPKEPLRSGDIMRMTDIEYNWGGKTSGHYAIVVEIIDNNLLRIADQNVAGVRLVKIREFNLNDIKKGKVEFFRPSY